MKNKSESVIERLQEVSYKEIKAKYPDKIVDAYTEGERLVVVMDSCRIKFDERVPQRQGNVYGSIHRK
tara:strand:+ start:282 stop:485 length:204 start_codon:yes stop_codon:yes gene_type:complete